MSVIETILELDQDQIQDLEIIVLSARLEKKLVMVVRDIPLVDRSVMTIAHDLLLDKFLKWLQASKLDEWYKYARQEIFASKTGYEVYDRDTMIEYIDKYQFNIETAPAFIRLFISKV